MSTQTNGAPAVRSSVCLRICMAASCRIQFHSLMPERRAPGTAQGRWDAAATRRVLTSKGRKDRATRTSSVGSASRVFSSMSQRCTASTGRFSVSCASQLACLLSYRRRISPQGRLRHPSMAGPPLNSNLIVPSGLIHSRSTVFSQSVSSNPVIRPSSWITPI